MSDLLIELLGGFAISRGDQELPLPASRRARALLAYLILTGRPQRRDHLVDMFWDHPADPRAALRTALSRLRPLVNEPGAERLSATRDHVRFAPLGARIDWLALEDPESLDEAQRVDARQALAQPLLAGLDLPDLQDWQAFLTAARSDAELRRARLGGSLPALPSVRPAQRIGFARAADDVRIAWASVGEGPPLMKAANWLNHLERDWDSPVWAPLFHDLARDHRFIRYDERGNGMSDWQVADLSFEAFVADLETVVNAARLSRFPLLGLSQGVAVAIAYAARHPERVSHLILWGGYAAGWRIDGDPALQEERTALITLVRNGWGRDDPSYRQIFSRAFMPSASPDELARFDAFQRFTTSPTNAARFLETFADIDVRHLLNAVRCPTLVMHARGDRRVPLEQGARIAAGIPDARFLTFDTDNHLLLGNEPAATDFVAAVREFLALKPAD
jgi:pimeloyl-ACP methyl ester carboxylesterase